MQSFMLGIVKHVSSKDNPADILTRNPYINELEWMTMDEEEKATVWVTGTQFILHGGRIFKISRFKPKLYVPQPMRKLVIQMCHDSKFSGHGGILATDARIKQDFFWKGSLQDVTKYIKKFTSCQRNKRGAPQKVPTGKVGLQEGTQLPFLL